MRRRNFSQYAPLAGIHETYIEYLLITFCKLYVEGRGRQFDYSKDIEAHIREAAFVLAGKTPQFGLLIVGNCGNGKTTLLHAMQSTINYLLLRHKISNGIGLAVVSAKAVKMDNDREKWFTNHCREPYLGIDDLGIEASENVSYGNVATPMIDLLEYRYQRRLFTVITSNLTEKERLAKYGTRIADRSKEMFRKIVFKEQSYR